MHPLVANPSLGCVSRYCPSTLYGELVRGLHTRLLGGNRELTHLGADNECAATIDTLLHSPLSYTTVRELGDARCVEAVRALTLRVCNTATDATAARLVQKQLAQALLRWSLLREDSTPIEGASV